MTSKLLKIPVKNTDQFLLVDEADAHLIKGRNWSLLRNGYISCASLVGDGYSPKITIYPQRLIMGLKPKDGLVVDFIDHNPFNLTRSNLRVCKQEDSVKNRRKGPGKTTSQYKGVTANGSSWQVSMRINNKYTYIGCYKTEEEAARAYDAQAIIHHKAFAHLNFPTQEVI